MASLLPDLLKLRKPVGGQITLVMPALIGQWQITVVNSALIGQFVVTKLKKNLLSSICHIVVKTFYRALTESWLSKLSPLLLPATRLSDQLNSSDFPFVVRVGTGARSNSSLIVHVVKIVNPTWISKSVFKMLTLIRLLSLDALCYPGQPFSDWPVCACLA